MLGQQRLGNLGGPAVEHNPVAVFSEIGDGRLKIVPDVLVGSGSPIAGLAAMLTQALAGNGTAPPAVKAKVKQVVEEKPKPPDET